MSITQQSDCSSRLSMLPPSLLPQTLFHYCRSRSSAELFSRLASQPQELLIFFNAACDDEEWALNHPAFLFGVLDWLNRSYRAGELPTGFLRAALAPLRNHFSTLKELIPMDLTLIAKEHQAKSSFLFLSAFSPYLEHLAARLCKIEKRTQIRLDENLITPENLPFFLEYIHSGSIQGISSWKSEQILSLLFSSHLLQTTPLTLLCSDNYKKYLTEENALPLLLQATQVGIPSLQHACINTLNANRGATDSWQQALTIAEDGKLIFRFENFSAKTLQRFTQLSSMISRVGCSGSLSENPAFAQILRSTRTIDGLDLTASDLVAQEFLIKQELPSLHWLSLARCPWLDEANLALILHRHQALTHLSLAHNQQLSTATWLLLHQAKELASLDLSNCSQFSDAELMILSYSVQNLRSLTLTHCDALSSLGLLAFAKKTHTLQKLDLAYTDADDDLLYELASSASSLEELNIFRCPAITVQGLFTALKGLSSLKKLRLDRTAISGEILQKLEKTFPSLLLELDA